MKKGSRAARLASALENVSAALADVEELRDEMQNWLDSIPENLQNGSKAEEVESAIDSLEEVISSLEEAQNVSFPGMFV